MYLYRHSIAIIFFLTAVLSAQETTITLPTDDNSSRFAIRNSSNEIIFSCGGDKKIGIGLLNPIHGFEILDGSFNSTGAGAGYRIDGNLVLTQSGTNAFLGISAGSNITSGGSKNVFIGHNAGLATSNGDQNVFVGYYAGRSTNGYQNTFIGSEAGYLNVSGTGNVFIGHQAGRNETGSNLLYIANTNTSSPLIYGNFSSGSIKINGRITARDIMPDGDLTYDIGGNISRWNNIYAGQVNYVSLNNISDIRYKENIRKSDYGLSEIIKLNPVNFDYKRETFNRKESSPEIEQLRKDHIGFIAQEMKEILPELVNINQSDKLEINMIELLPVIVNAIKEQQNLIQKQDKSIEWLKEKVQQLELVINKTEVSHISTKQK